MITVGYSTREHNPQFIEYLKNSSGTKKIQVIVFNTNNHSVMISKGMKVGQAVLCPVINGEYVRFQQVDQLDEKDRGDNGFGSTGI